MNESLRQELIRLVPEGIQWDCSLKGYTTFRIGGPAKVLVTVHGDRELQALLALLASHDVSWCVIGKGSNLLVSDSGYDGVVLLLSGAFQEKSVERVDDGRVRLLVGAGCALSGVSTWCAEQGLSGCEFACGIPGTVGGGIRMNAGAWGGEIADVLHAVTLMGPKGEKRYGREELDLGYRSWRNYTRDHGGQIIVGAEFILNQDDPERVKATCADFRRRRNRLQPAGRGNAGSFFKNPQNDSAGRLIEACGCKGTSIGGAMVSPQHANFFVNTGDAQAADVVQLMRLVQEKVKEKSGIDLEPEVHFLP